MTTVIFKFCCSMIFAVLQCLTQKREMFLTQKKAILLKCDGPKMKLL